MPPDKPVAKVKKKVVKHVSFAINEMNLEEAAYKEEDQVPDACLCDENNEKEKEKNKDDNEDCLTIVEEVVWNAIAALPLEESLDGIVPLADSVRRYEGEIYREVTKQLKFRNVNHLKGKVRPVLREVISELTRDATINKPEACLMPVALASEEVEDYRWDLAALERLLEVKKKTITQELSVLQDEESSFAYLLPPDWLAHAVPVCTQSSRLKEPFELAAVSRHRRKKNTVRVLSRVRNAGVSTTINGLDFHNCISDSGAGITAISEEAWKRLNSPTLEDEDINVVTASNKPLKVLGSTLLNFTFNRHTYRHQVVVLQDLKYEVVLGVDFFMAIGIILDFRRARMVLPDNGFVPLRVWKDESAFGNITAMETTIIPPQFRINVTGKVSGIPELTNICARADFAKYGVNPAQQHLLGGNTLSTVSEGTVTVQIINNTRSPIKLYKDQTLADIELVVTEHTSDLDGVTISSIADENNKEKELKRSQPSIVMPQPPGNDQEDVTGAQSKELQQMEDWTKLPIETQEKLNAKFERVKREVSFPEAITEVERQRYYSLICRYLHVFYGEELPNRVINTQKIPPARIVTTDQVPVARAPYRLSFTERQIINDKVDLLEKEGKIRPSYSDFAAPIVLADKPDGTKRMCVDYRGLNAKTIKDRFPLPRVQDCLDALGGCAYFSALDLQDAFHQHPLAVEDMHKTAFITPQGLYEWITLPFGLVNAPALFQRAVSLAMQGLTWQLCLVYMDDIIVYSKTFEDHIAHIEQVFKRLDAAHLHLKAKKCSFGLSEVAYLGHIVSANGIRPNPKKLQAVQEMQPPSTVTGVRCFLGLAGHYRRFVPNFSIIARPLSQLTSSANAFVWTTECDESFKQLKQALVTAPVIAYPDFNKEFTITTDACGTGVGAVLSQLGEDGREKVIAYASRVLNKHERNYTITELECLGVVFGIKQFRPYVYGTKFKVHTDHSALKWLLNLKDPSGRLGRWALKLQECDMEVHYKPGTSIPQADALSRYAGCYRSADAVVSKEVEEMMLIELAEDYIVWEIPTEVPFNNESPALSSISTTIAATRKRKPQVIMTSEDILEEVRDLQDRTPWMNAMKKFIEKGEIPQEGSEVKAVTITKSAHKYAVEDDILYLAITSKSTNRRRLLLVIPEPLREKLCLQFHSDAFAGHLGSRITYEKMRIRYYWPKMAAYIKEFCRSCAVCNRFKHFNPASVRSRMEIIGESEVLGTVAMDIVGPLPTSSNGNKYALVVVDHLSRWPVVYPLKSKSAAHVRSALIRFVCDYGCPARILTDNGGEFLDTIMTSVYKMFGVKKLNTTSYRPSTNGINERFNQTLIEMVRALAQGINAKSWEDMLPFALFAYRTAYHPATGDTPFYLMYGREPRLPIDLLFNKIPADLPRTGITQLQRFRRQLVQNLITAREIAADSIRLTQEDRVFNSNREHRGEPYQVGERVWVYFKDNSAELTGKMTTNWHGPFRIVQVASNSTVKIQGAYNWKHRPVVNIARVRRCYDADSRPTADPEDLVDHVPTDISKILPPDSFLPEEDLDDEEYDVEMIKGKRYALKGDGTIELQWLVSFTGYDPTYDKWLPDYGINAPAKIREFERKIRRLNTTTSDDSTVLTEDDTAKDRTLNDGTVQPRRSARRTRANRS